MMARSIEVEVKKLKQEQVAAKNVEEVPKRSKRLNSEFRAPTLPQTTGKKPFEYLTTLYGIMLEDQDNVAKLKELLRQGCSGSAANWFVTVGTMLPTNPELVMSFLIQFTRREFEDLCADLRTARMRLANGDTPGETWMEFVERLKQQQLVLNWASSSKVTNDTISENDVVRAFRYGLRGPMGTEMRMHLLSFPKATLTELCERATSWERIQEEEIDRPEGRVRFANTVEEVPDGPTLSADDVLIEKVIAAIAAQQEQREEDCSTSYAVENDRGSNRMVPREAVGNPHQNGWNNGPHTSHPWTMPMGASPYGMIDPRFMMGNPGYGGGRQQRPFQDSTVRRERRCFACKGPHLVGNCTNAIKKKKWLEWRNAGQATEGREDFRHDRTSSN